MSVAVAAARLAQPARGRIGRRTEALQFAHGIDRLHSRAARALAAAMREAGGGIAVIADRARAPAQRRQRPPVPPRQLLPLPDRLRRAAAPGWCSAATAARTLSAAPKRPRARDLGRLAPRPRRPRRRRSASTTRSPLDAARRSDASSALANQPAVWLPFGTRRARARASTAGSSGAARQARAAASRAPSAQRDLAPLLDEMRLHQGRRRDRDDAPRRARSAPARTRARCASAPRAFAPTRAAACASTRSRPSCCTSSAATARRARPTPASSPPAPTPACCTTRAGDAALKAGELCLIDAGCELDGYASDVTRTFPADGRFSAAAARALRHRATPRRPPRSPRPAPARASATRTHAAVRVLAQGMLDSGLLDRDAVGDVDAVIESAAYRQFYMHGTGHWLGRDVHDVGDYLRARRGAGRAARRPGRHGRARSRRASSSRAWS